MLLRLVSVLSFALLVSAQTAPSPDTVPNSVPTYKFLSGTVEKVDATSLVVRRSHLGRRPEIRKFRLTPETEIEGNLKAKTRVTVGYTSNEEGDTAARVIVRPQVKKQTSVRNHSIGRTSSSPAVS